MLRKRPSFYQFLYSTGASLGFFIAIGLWLAIIVFSSFQLYFFSSLKLNNAMSLFGIMLALICIVVTISIFYKKHKLLVTIFETGTETPGMIVDLYFRWGGGYVTYEYLYADRKYRSTDRIRKTRIAKEFSVGQKVVLYINHKNPLQAFIRDLYLNTF